MNEINDLGAYIAQLAISVGFAFLLGMEIYIKTPDEERKFLFGTERTLSFIALLGFVLLKSQSLVHFGYIAGFLVISLFLAIYYFNKVNKSDNEGVTLIVLGLLVYAFPLIVAQFPIWFSMLVIVIVMILVESKDQLKEFSKKIYRDDFITLSKFVFLSGVILPLVPDKEIITGVPVSPYKLWLAIVVISAISYFSYLLRKYVFPKAGLFLTGILGGLYSSTATTFIVARKSREQADSPSQYAAAILSATGLMFLRIYLLLVVFNPPMGIQLLPQFLLLFAVSVLVTFVLYRLPATAHAAPAEVSGFKHQNPLELKVALVFGIMYIVFSLMTQYTVQYFGHQGLSLLSVIIGFSDIDPFLLNMFQGKNTGLDSFVIATATLQAIMSNNILKMVYSLILGDKSIRKYVLSGFLAIILTNLLVLGWMYYRH